MNTSNPNQEHNRLVSNSKEKEYDDFDAKYQKSINFRGLIQSLRSKQIRLKNTIEDFNNNEKSEERKTKINDMIEKLTILNGCIELLTQENRKHDIIDYEFINNIKQEIVNLKSTINIITDQHSTEINELKKKINDFVIIIDRKKTEINELTSKLQLQKKMYDECVTDLETKTTILAFVVEETKHLYPELNRNSQIIDNNKTETDIIPVTIVEEKKSEKNDLICPICQRDFETTLNIKKVRTGCGHYYCYDCLTRWLDNKTTCPMCIRRVTKLKTVNDEGNPTLDETIIIKKSKEERKQETEFIEVNNAIRQIENQNSRTGSHIGPQVDYSNSRGNRGNRGSRGRRGQNRGHH